MLYVLLSQVRGYFPQAESFLMDPETLEEFRHLWGQEDADKRCTAELTNLSGAERTFFVDLRNNAIGENIRLEQERIAFSYLCRRLKDVGF